MITLAAPASRPIPTMASPELSMRSDDRRRSGNTGSLTARSTCWTGSLIVIDYLTRKCENVCFQICCPCDAAGVKMDPMAQVRPYRGVEATRRLAERYRLEFLDMHEFRIDQELFRSIPADLMLRYGFVPYRRDGKSLVIVVSDPTDLPMIDELGVILGTHVRVMVGARSAIEGMLKKSESSQRVLDEATEEFQIQVLKEDESGEDNLTVERLTSDSSPIIR